LVLCGGDQLLLGGDDQSVMSGGNRLVLCGGDQLVLGAGDQFIFGGAHQIVLCGASSSCYVVATRLYQVVLTFGISW